MLTAEQILAAHKANVETLFGLTNKAFEGVEKLVELNLQVASLGPRESGRRFPITAARREPEIWPRPSAPWRRWLTGRRCRSMVRAMK